MFPVVITGGQEARYRDGYFPTLRTELLLGVQQALEMDGLAVAQEVKGGGAGRGVGELAQVHRNFSAVF